MNKIMTISEIYQNYYNPNTAVCIDNRKVKKGSIFIGLGRKNEKGVHRGCQFAEAAIDAGAAAVIINDPELKAKYANDERWILVEDGEQALQDLAREHRKHLDIPIIAVAGSNGKTTTRELIEAVLAKKYKVFSTPSNLNNHLGVPLSMLMIDPSIEIAILEIGANHLGETKFLVELLQPTIGLVTNHGKDHLGEYGSFDNVIKANKELYDYFEDKGEGLVLVNAQDVSIMESSADLDNRLFFGRPDMDTVWAQILSAPDLKLAIHIEAKHFEVELALFGGFWKSAVLTAVQLGVHFGLSAAAIQEALIEFKPASLRSEHKIWNGHQLLLDCYNANPSSMQAFLRAVQNSAEQPKLLILGEMLELGQYSKEEHQNLLEQWINYDAYTAVFLIGESFAALDLELNPKIKHYLNADLMEEELMNLLKKQNYHIYLKGSRANRLEKIFK
jgi:UDP-N-acetylmuramoyl-tripeptide--D-alanyl-D-alanine ligase